MYKNRTKYIRLKTTFHLTLVMTSAQVVETSVTTTDNSPSQDYTQPDDQTTLSLLVFSTIISSSGGIKSREGKILKNYLPSVRKEGWDWNPRLQVHFGSDANFRGFFIPVKESDASGLRVDGWPANRWEDQLAKALTEQWIVWKIGISCCFQVV